MTSPMVRKERQTRQCANLVDKLYLKMSEHDKREFVRALADALALKLSPADRDEWIEKMQRNLNKENEP